MSRCFMGKIGSQVVCTFRAWSLLYFVYELPRFPLPRAHPWSLLYFVYECRVKRRFVFSDITRYTSFFFTPRMHQIGQALKKY